MYTIQELKGTNEQANTKQHSNTKQAAYLCSTSITHSHTLIKTVSPLLLSITKIQSTYSCVSAHKTIHSTMEMTKKPSTSTTEQADIPPPSPFVSASAEREELERLVSSTSSATTRSSSSSSRQNYIPTAVPITNGDRFDENAPVAVATSVASLPSSSASAAVSNNNASTTKKESSKSDDKSLDDDDIKVEAITNNNFNNNIPTASTLPTHTVHIPSTQQQTTQSLLRAANVGGQIRSEEEFASVARAARHKPSIQSNTDNLVQIANTKAKPNKYKQDEGLTVDEAIHHLSNSTLHKLEIPSTTESDIRPYSNAPAKAKGGGYETKEYETKEYETSEYETSEYKSVYDD